MGRREQPSLLRQDSQPLQANAGSKQSPIYPINVLTSNCKFYDENMLNILPIDVQEFLRDQFSVPTIQYFVFVKDI